MGRTLPVVNVPSPCPVSWARMHGDDSRRVCAQCGHPVHNLSAMAGDAVARLLDERRDDEKLCVAFYQDHGGGVVPGEGHQRRRWRLENMSAAALFAFLGIWQPARPAPMATIRGTIRDSQEHRVGGGRVTAWRPGAEEKFEARTAKDGTYRLALPAGEYVIDYGDSGLERCQAHPVTVKAGSTTKIDVTLRAMVIGEVVYAKPCHSYRGR